jgi:hypothetical protein
VQNGKTVSDVDSIVENIAFSQPIIKENGRYISINVEGANSCLMETGEPILPVYTRTFKFPFGTKIVDVKCLPSGIQQRTLSKEIVPAPEPIPVSAKILTIKAVQKGEIYSSANLYPDSWYDYRIGCGLDGDRHVIFLTVRFYPIRYSPAESIIYYTSDAEIKIAYDDSRLITFPDKYKMVIIAPLKFSDELQPLVEHKNNHNMTTKLVTVEEIYGNYTGRDQPEQIKYFIKDAKEKWGIKYVLLVGGMKSLLFGTRRDDCNQGSKDWYVPVRYTNLVEMGLHDPGYISDLYYADIYKYENGKPVFDNWDSNGNDIFAEWKGFGKKDILDLYPDVYVGRLPCRNNYEVKIMVDKIISYESSAADPSWFKKMVVVGSDTFDDVSSTNYYEGEVETQKALDYMTGFDPVRIWGSNRDTGGLVPEPRDITRTITSGCGFLYFSGHGSPSRWNTYWPEAFDEPRAGGLWIYHMPRILNHEKLPVCVVGGCHNSQFNVTALCFLNFWFHKTGWVYIPTPECWSWLLTRKIGGGSIATIGNTGLGYGTVGEHGDLDGDGINDPDCVEWLGGYIERQFWKAYGEDGVDILGETWGQAVTEYLKTFPGMEEQADCKTVQEWILLGDPSLQIGGYS